MAGPERAQQLVPLPHIDRPASAAQAEAGQGAGRLADVPLDRVEPVAAVADVRGADQDIYAQQVLLDGTLEGDNIPVTNAHGVQEWPVIAAGGVDDAVLVVWEDWRNGDRREPRRRNDR